MTAESSPEAAGGAPGWHLAQVNIGRLIAPIDDERVAGFVERLDAVNAAAEAAPGFVWRLKTESGNATDVTVPGDPMAIINLSVWESIESLHRYVYGEMHLEPLRQRARWFERLGTAHMALWWVPAAHRPGVDEAVGRLERLRREGPGPLAFSFKRRFPPPAPGSAD